ncbi:histidine kinase [Solimonas variicoloris]|uniref:histidine kinase n=1 Tax=Solimonas variicoloris TaxID=254408 RepID=UPI00036BCE39|nr:histidine kinase [Solimonas variicoloris]
MSASAPSVAAPRRDGRGLRALDLRWRLSAGIGLILLACLSLASVLAIREARRSVALELRAGVSAAAGHLDLTLGLLDDVPGPAASAALREWAQAYAGSRHLCLAVADLQADARRAADCAPRAPRRAPDWFADGIVGAPAPVERIWTHGDARYAVRIVPMPDDEIDEAWSDVRGVLVVLVAMGFAINLLVFAWLSRSLRPLSQAVVALERMREGQFETRLPRGGTPELRRLLTQVEALARQLAGMRQQNRRLLLQRLDVQEEERRYVARELHDEIGQHVAAIEVEAATLVAAPGRLDEAALRAGLGRIRALAGEVHDISRRMIQRLRPPTLDALGLVASLESLLAQWRQRRPDWALQAAFDPDCDAAADELAIHVFRIVQEGLSNIARHAEASHVVVRVEFGEPDARGARALQLLIADNGRGFDVHLRPAGLGIVGLAERVDALGGRLQVDSGRGLGCRLHVGLPFATR